ncbi:hypothetical protein EI94DRAFT_1768822 [Lactarius quietus]|nr:hypothetical protein EI94DRAFT_1768822 [Lactarius quietus]
MSRSLARLLVPARVRLAFANAAIAANGNNGNNRPLNVTDALSYLDAVKVQFYDKPDVYNHFLDIMKDFKSQIIDTPGVIERVSMLFHGNPYLIEGFNTFLPPGYHINASADPSLITVTTPLGTVTSKINSGTHSTGVGGPSFYGSPHPYAPQAGGSRPDTPLARMHPPQTFSPAPQGLATAVASVLGNMGNKSQVERAPAAEFDHAIQYLNKIKTSYPDDQNNTYKQFLEILQTYRKEQQTSLKEPVYIQVQALFKDEAELLREFKDFLPEIAGTSTQKGGLVGIRPYPLDNSNATGAMWSHDTTATASTAPKGTQPPSRRRKREQPKEPPPAAKQPETTRRPRVTRPPAKNHAQSPTFTSYQTPPSPLPGPAHFAQHSQAVSQFGHNLQGHHGAQAGSSSVQQGGPSSPQNELMFFERAKRALEARDVYDHFLKLLNMFTRDIIDLKTLVVRAEKILADDMLFAQFKQLVNWDDRIGNVNYGPPGSIRTGPHDAALPRPVDDAQSPSYRRLPESEIRLATSGRDQLARSVLNDEWVSHPTWASEEAGFVAHKKNSFEEVIHRCEDERHEYQIQLEGLSRTIGILEPLATRLNEMPLGERALLRLRPDLGGQSRWIYMRTLKKVYGKDAGTEVYQALQEAPAVAVPVVLARLKQKNEEWRRAQREWSITWRQVDARNFYKSLDHTGINCKQNDKKAITTKAFVTEIDNVRTEQEVQERQQLQQKRPREKGAGHNRVRPACARGSLGFQLSYSFADSGVLCDALKLVYSYLDHNQATYSLPERRSVERFLRAFMPVLCMLPPAAFNAACGPPEIGVDDDSGDEQQPDDVSIRTNAAGGGGGGVGVHAGDLRKKLARAAAHEKNGADIGGSHVSTPADGRDVHNPKGKEREKEERRGVVSQGVWIREYLAEGAIDIRDAPVSTRPFFSNTTFYTLLRLLQLLYSRLSSCKEEGRKHARQRFRHLVANPIAVELGMDDSQGPSSVLEQILRDRTFMNELDQATFEEHMRWFFGTRAFLLYTVDKIVASLIKQVQTIVSDNKCQELWQFLRRHRSEVSFTRQDIIKYRRKAEQHVGADDNLYRVEWKPEDKSLHIQLMGPGEASVDDSRTSVNRWREYVDSVWGMVTSPVCLSAGENLTSDDGFSMTQHEGEMGIRISLGTYRVFHESGTEWTMTRSRGREEEKLLEERARQREEERRRRLGAILLAM